ncbi:60 kDa lysophospholipase isoform X10 [Gorilla gorilla gorilla]|uniref:60 kDa lysophospholipase isoform X10 n=1 Tax=Gorilla gorilla gorilla TaxID=9595 RepID=UPI00300B426B
MGCWGTASWKNPQTQARTLGSSRAWHEGALGRVWQGRGLPGASTRSRDRRGSGHVWLWGRLQKRVEAASLDLKTKPACGSPGSVADLLVAPGPLSRTGQRKLPGSTVNRELVRKVDGKAGLVVHSSMEQDVGLLRLYPGIPAALVRAFLQPPLKGVVMETFGSGNGPTKPDLLQELRVAAERGLVIVNCTHCLQGAVTTDYAAGMAMAGAGVISGFDMTSEAALAKLSYVLGQPGLSLDDRKELLTKDLRGEMTPPSVEECRPSLQGNTLGRGVSWLLSLSGSQEADALRNALVPSLACVAAHAGDLEALQALVELGSDLGLVDLHGQTPLHAAARGGHTEAVTMLLQRGVDVNTRDTDGFSPLLLAVRGRHPGVIGLLREAGASLSTQELEEAGTELCRLAYRADLEGLQVWWQAGADLGQPGYDGHSALHVAEAAGNLAVVAFLQSLEGAVGAQAPCPFPWMLDTGATWVRRSHPSGCASGRVRPGVG